MSQPPRASRPRLPAFHPVPTRTRCDGWTPARQAEFIGVLAETGSVSAAAGPAGRPLIEPGSEVAGLTWKVTDGSPWREEMTGVWRPVLRGGSYAGCVFKPDKSTLCTGPKALGSASAARRRALAAGPSSRSQAGDHA